MSNDQQTHEQHIATVRTALLNQAFQFYHQFVTVLKQLPLNQAHPLLVEGLTSIDVGMLCVKEILSTQPLLLQPPQPDPAPVAPGEPHPQEEHPQPVPAPEAA